MRELTAQEKRQAALSEQLNRDHPAWVELSNNQLLHRHWQYHLDIVRAARNRARFNLFLRRRKNAVASLFRQRSGDQ